MFPDKLGRIKDIEIFRDFPLNKLTTFRIGGRARYLICPHSVDAFSELLCLLDRYDIKYHILGGGSNLLINNREFDVVISTRYLNDISGLIDRGENVWMTFYAGLSLKKAISWLYKNGLSGFEDLVCIPGSIGGAIRMNAGVKDYSISDSLLEVLILEDKQIKWVSREEIPFTYRDSGLGENCLVLAGRFEFCKRNREEIKGKISQNIEKRLKNQPLSKPSAGCVFKNLKDISAGRLIDMCGLKGANRGDAFVSEKHANFIINRGNASFNDVLNLMQEVREKVFYKTGYVLNSEIKIWY